MDALDDIAAFTELAQRRFGVLRNRTLAGTELIAKAQKLQIAQESDLERMEFVGLAVETRRRGDDAGAVAVAGGMQIQIGPTIRLDLGPERVRSATRSGG